MNHMDMTIRYLTTIAWIWAVVTSLWAIGLLLNPWSFDLLGRRHTALGPIVLGLPAWIWLYVRYHA